MGESTEGVSVGVLEVAVLGVGGRGAGGGADDGAAVGCLGCWGGMLGFGCGVLGRRRRRARGCVFHVKHMFIA